MIDFLLLPQNQVFTFALGLMVAIVTLEFVSLLIGLGLSDVLDQVMPDIDVDVDADIDADLDTDLSGAGGSFAQILSWMNVGRVPVLMLLLIFLSSFGLCGLFAQRLMISSTGFALPAVFLSVPAFIAAIFSVRVGGKAVARVMPKEETSAVSEKTFIGRTATIVLGTAAKGDAAQAKLEDAFKQTHYILVEPDNATETLPEGADVLIVRQEGTVFFAIKNTHPSLTPDARSS